MKKRYLLDTNVLLHDPKALTAFQDNDVLLPIYVIEEIDRFKKEMTRLGENARQISRFLDELRRRGRLADGVTLEGGGTLRVVFDADGPGRGARTFEAGWVDNAILDIARRLADETPEPPLILVTKDINLRIKADSLGLSAEDYETDRVRLDDLYTGQTEIEVPAGALAAFLEGGDLPLPEGAFVPNQYALLRESGEGSGRTALARIDTLGGRLVRLHAESEGVLGIRPRNKEQYFALDALLDPSIVLVTVMGKAGTGKTLLALAAGLRQVLARAPYRHLLVSRPTFPMGKDIGYLPGTVEEKLNPWMQPIYDNLALILEGRGGNGVPRSAAELIERGTLAVEPLTHIRGRSIPQQYMLVDEAQNLTPLEVKTILTRVGENTKLVLTGDPWQIDTPYIDSSTNGFNHVVHHFRDVPLAAHVSLRKGERSKLAEYAANLL